MKIVLIAIASLTLASAAVAAQDRYRCENVHTFDFWAGDFDATPWNQPQAQPGGQLHNTREYHGCVIVERWTGKNSTGMSMAFYDVSRHVWRMVWMGDDGISNDLQGSFHDGAMRMTGWMVDQASGKRLRISNVLRPVSHDTIRHTFSVSTDGGKTWTVKSDGRFVRRKP
jgi:hypothetical protein